MFTDRVILQVRAGKGGDGVVAWRREKYIPKGGPCGGDGGRGGAVYLRADSQLSSLESYRNHTLMRAEDGRQGGSNNCKGRDGEDLILKVPCGTLIKDCETKEVLFDLTEEGQQVVLCKGGKGGKGNSRFKSPTNRAPLQFTYGTPGEESEVEFELKLIADVGLVGFPNAGKSSLTSQLTHTPVKIAPYPFTTLRPHLGFLYTPSKRLLLADIPGIIRGAHENRGLGHAFLRHIERTHLLLFVVDISGFEGRDPCEDFKTLRSELAAHDEELCAKPFLVVLNKIDLEGARSRVSDFRKAFPSLNLIEVSAETGEGLETLKEQLAKPF